MCGIAGIVDLEGKRPIARAELVAMADAIRHRGPDSEGIHLADGVGLAFRRLAIIDLTTGDQPIHAPEREASIIFNGELYNYLELREQLIAKGHVFTTRTDTEVVLRGYFEWGERGICERGRGMFAFAIHDRRNRRVIVARDALGKKPVYFARIDGRVAFASEIKALLTDPRIARTLAPTAILDYTTLGYTLQESTIFGAIERLLPGSYAVLENGTMRCERYFRVPFAPIEISYRDAVERTAELARVAVKRRLMSDVPLGCFLSGGLDSSLVCASMVDMVGTSLNAITVGFDDDKEADERAAARETGRVLGIVPQEEVVRTDPAVLDAIAKTFDEPHADPSAVPTYELCRATRRRVTVALSGDGGDESFGGYRRYRFDLVENRIRALIPAVLRRSVLGPVGRAWPKADYLPRPLRAKTLIENVARDPVEAYYRSVARVRPEDALSLLDPDLRRTIGEYRPLERFRRIDRERGLLDPLSRIRALDFETWLPDDILVKVDRASMANSLEVRAPLLDADLVSFASGLPAEYLIAKGSGKRVLKDAARRILPDHVIDRRKHGFDLPVKRWLDGPLAAELDSLGEKDSPLAGIYDLGEVASRLREHRLRRRDRSAELWMLLMFGRFMRTYGTAPPR